MPYHVDDTIVAIATAPGGAARGVVRISGPETGQCLERCFRAASPIDWRSLHLATVVPGSLTLHEPRRAVPCDLYWWPTRRSYTRQPSAELHTLGAPPLLEALVDTLCQYGARPAEPGEFTLRAFLAGRIDLTQAEAVLGVIDARDARTLNVALQQLAGGLAGPLRSLRSDLLDLLADLEAGLDFVDEDIEFIAPEEGERRLAAAGQHLRELLQQLDLRGISHPGPRVVLHGEPNVGKSSLINALAETPVAIVSDCAGTTRDYVTCPFAWHGIEGLLVDTAGVAAATPDDMLSAAAQDMSDREYHQADLELLCLDANRTLSAWERAAVEQATATPRLVVWTKIDRATNPQADPWGDAWTSSRTGAGVPQLRELIATRLAAAPISTGQVAITTSQRCRHSLELAAERVAQAQQLWSRGETPELVAWELRETLSELGQVVGAVYTEDLLDRVFSRFCIGK